MCLCCGLEDITFFFLTYLLQKFTISMHMIILMMIEIKCKLFLDIDLLVRENSAGYIVLEKV